MYVFLHEGVVSSALHIYAYICFLFFFVVLSCCTNTMQTLSASSQSLNPATTKFKRETEPWYRGDVAAANELGQRLRSHDVSFKSSHHYGTSKERKCPSFSNACRTSMLNILAPRTSQDIHRDWSNVALWLNEVKPQETPTSPIESMEYSFKKKDCNRHPVSKSSECNSPSRDEKSGSEHNQSDARKLKPMKLQFFRTKMCPWVVSVGHCRKGSSCRYAHCAEEIRPLPDLSKTKFCPQLLEEGECPNRSRCKYAHCYDELRATQSFSKTKLCPLWLANKCGMSESMCRFAHGENDLRHITEGPVEERNVSGMYESSRSIVRSLSSPLERREPICQRSSPRTEKQHSQTSTVILSDDDFGPVHTSRTDPASPAGSLSHRSCIIPQWRSPHTGTTAATTCGVSRQSPRTEPPETTTSESSFLLVPQRSGIMPPFELYESMTHVPKKDTSSVCESPHPAGHSRAFHHDFTALSSIPWSTTARKESSTVLRGEDLTPAPSPLSPERNAVDDLRVETAIVSPCVTPVRVSCRSSTAGPAESMAREHEMAALRLPFSPLPLVLTAVPSSGEVPALRTVEFGPPTGSLHVPSQTSLAVDRLLASPPPKDEPLDDGLEQHTRVMCTAVTTTPSLSASTQPPSSLLGAPQFLPPGMLSSTSQARYGAQNHVALWGVHSVVSSPHRDQPLCYSSPPTHATLDGWDFCPKTSGAEANTVSGGFLPTPAQFFFRYASEVRTGGVDHDVFPSCSMPASYETDSQPSCSRQTPERRGKSRDDVFGVGVVPASQGPFFHSMVPVHNPVSPGTASTGTGLNQLASLFYTSGFTPSASWALASAPQRSPTRGDCSVIPQIYFQPSGNSPSTFKGGPSTGSPTTLRSTMQSSPSHVLQYTMPSAATQPPNRLFLSPPIRLTASPLTVAFPCSSNYTVTEKDKSPVTLDPVRDSSALLPGFPFFPLHVKEDGSAPLQRTCSDADATATRTYDHALLGSPLTTQTTLSCNLPRCTPPQTSEYHLQKTDDLMERGTLRNSPRTHESSTFFWAPPADPMVACLNTYSCQRPSPDTGMAENDRKEDTTLASSCFHPSVKTSAPRVELTAVTCATPAPVTTPSWSPADDAIVRSNIYPYNASGNFHAPIVHPCRSVPSHHTGYEKSTDHAHSQEELHRTLSSAVSPVVESKNELRDESTRVEQNSVSRSTFSHTEERVSYRRSVPIASPSTGVPTRTPHGHSSPGAPFGFLYPHGVAESSSVGQRSVSPSLFSSSPWTSRVSLQSPHTTTATIYSHPYTAYHSLA